MTDRKARMAFNSPHHDNTNLKTFPVCSIRGLEFTFSPTGNVTKTNVCVRHVASGLPVIYFNGVKSPHKICRIVNAILARFPHFRWNLPAEEIATRKEEMAEIVTTLEHELRQSGIRDLPHC